MDAITLLTEEHKKAKAAFEKIEATTEADKKQTLLKELIAELRSHTKIEEEVLYPVLREQLTGGPQLFEESMQEHHEAKKAMAKLEDLSSDDPEWQQQFDILMHGVLHHATEEEADMFPKMREQWDDTKLENLGKKLAADKTGELVVDLTVEELQEQAKAADIEGRSKLDKAGLEEALGHR